MVRANRREFARSFVSNLVNSNNFSYAQAYQQLHSQGPVAGCFRAPCKEGPGAAMILVVISYLLCSVLC